MPIATGTVDAATDEIVFVTLTMSGPRNVSIGSVTTTLSPTSPAA